ncbi:hypothetical protein RRG08_044528 [Elysia crispata]|uniref:Uncharacterized protein n=1 Tax=Elysia crispata TaxID=231223 RepID=A0AAE0ZBC4_9GAST|nr:hypothetical protein RRG08_044528 [Elysia crispata]
MGGKKDLRPDLLFFVPNLNKNDLPWIGSKWVTSRRGATTIKDALNKISLDIHRGESDPRATWRAVSFPGSVLLSGDGVKLGYRVHGKCADLQSDGQLASLAGWSLDVCAP